MLQVYSTELGTLKPIPNPRDPADLAGAILIDFWDATSDEVQTVERALGIRIRMPEELDRFSISDQVQSANGLLTLKALVLAGLDRHQPALVPVTFIRTKGPMVTISKGSPNGLSWAI